MNPEKRELSQQTLESRDNLSETENVLNETPEQNEARVINSAQSALEKLVNDGEDLSNEIALAEGVQIDSELWDELSEIKRIAENAVEAIIPNDPKTTKIEKPGDFQIAKNGTVIEAPRLESGQRKQITFNFTRRGLPYGGEMTYIHGDDERHKIQMKVFERIEPEADAERYWRPEAVTEEQRDELFSARVANFVAHKEPGKDWEIFHRRVFPKFRGQGFGYESFVMMERTIQEYMKHNPETASEHLAVELGQPVLLDLLISQNWLKEHDATDLQHGRSYDFGYVPETKEHAQKVLMMLRKYKEILNRGAGGVDLTEAYIPQLGLSPIEGKAEEDTRVRIRKKLSSE